MPPEFRVGAPVSDCRKSREKEDGSQCSSYMMATSYPESVDDRHGCNGIAIDDMRSVANIHRRDDAMTIAYSPVRPSGRALSLDMPAGLGSAKLPNAPARGLTRSSAVFGIEVLRPKGWVPLTTAFSRRLRTFDSMADAMEACILHWRKTGHGVRPYSLSGR